jgi:hypothetical protein
LLVFLLAIGGSEAIEYVKNFRSDKHNDTTDKKKHPNPTHSVLFDTAIFRFIGHYLDTIQHKDIKYIKIMNIQYNKMLSGQVPGQRAEKQQSIIIVPARADKSTDWDAWNPDSFSFIPKFNKATFLGAVNHGQLCPTACPPEVAFK